LPKKAEYLKIPRIPLLNKNIRTRTRINYQKKRKIPSLEHLNQEHLKKHRGHTTPPVTQDLL
jgi:hypothetical protein